jgi:ABC-type lipoprotein export system ATPase subunit
MVTHSREAAQAATRIVELRDGRVVGDERRA